MNDVATENAAKKKPPVGRLVTIFSYMLLVCGVLFVLWAWQLFPAFLFSPSTDDAYVRGKVVNIASQVTGEVKKVGVSDFEHVKAGQMLFKIDEESYRITSELKKSQLEEAKLNLETTKFKILQADADIKQLNNQLQMSKKDSERAARKFARYQPLIKDQNISREMIDETEKEAYLASKQVGVVEAKLASAVAARQLLDAEIASLEQKVKTVELDYQQSLVDLRHTTVVAAADGTLGQIKIHPGQFISKGSSLGNLVFDQPWIIANIKETNLRDVKIGSQVSFTVDSLPYKRFKGRVTDIAPAMASEFGLLKPDNATGNFTKIVQRVSVRIEINEPADKVATMRPGMSVVVKF